MSVQETAGSSIAFAAIIHLGATVPTPLLRCVLNCQDMVEVTTADIDAVFADGGVLPAGSPGLGITVDRKVLGEPTSTWATDRKASFAQIARRAGLSSPGLISYHFANKDDLIGQAVAEICATGGAVVRSHSDAATSGCPCAGIRKAAEPCPRRMVDARPAS